jgi:hypothetical protein
VNEAALSSARTNTGQTLGELSQSGPVLIVFLRHTGCTFCREAIADVATIRPRVEANGATLALVHMGDESVPAHVAAFNRPELRDVPRVSDPDRALYAAAGLGRGSLGQLFGLRVWLRGFRAGVVDGHWVGSLVGDGFQMPGVFLMDHGKVVRSFIHRDASDRPDYASLACSPLAAAQKP